ncbi:MAG: hypothetical protein QM673_13050 [Gordonia sp. (in: high G+C Gram-positive bacteria)]
MNLADQIEAISRAATERVVGAARDFSAAQARLGAQLADHRRAAATSADQLRAELLDDAQVGGNRTPRIMLPADIAEASPHRPADTA